MDVPATLPEVTTTGIYGEALVQVRHRLSRSELSWCGDLTARTQVLIVGRVTPIGSRKLAVARGRRLPCVFPAWVTDGACSLDRTDAFDVCHELTGKEVCTTGLSHAERSRVQAVCVARGATYNSLLTRQCGLLVVPVAALALTSSSASSAGTANDKMRFARKHGVWTLNVEEFSLRYASELLPNANVCSSSNGVISSSCRGNGEINTDCGGAKLEEGDRQRASLKRLNGHNEDNNSYAHADVPPENKGSMKIGEPSGTVPARGVHARDILVPGSVRCTALTTPRPGAATTSNALDPYKLATPHTVDAADSWRNDAGVALSAVQPTLTSQLTAVASTGVSLAPSQSLHFLGDEFSDVVAYCSPPSSLTTAQHDLLTGMGVAVTHQLSPFTTHVLVLGDAVEECLYPRPGLQIVSWQWVVQSQVERRRLSCAGFRVPLTFCPVVTFTGLSAGDKHDLVAALRCSGLECEVQEALVLGGAGARGSHSGDGLQSVSTSSEGFRSFLPRSTTHLVSLHRQLLASQKVAVLAQRCQEYTRRRPSSSSSSTVVASSAASTCRLVGVDWIYRSIQHGRWLDPELFTLSIPHPEAFALAATHRKTTTLTTATIEIERGLLTPCHRSQSRIAAEVVAAAPTVSSSLPSVGSVITATAPTSSLAAPPPASPLYHSSRSPQRVDEEVVVVRKGIKEEEEEEEEGAALSQQNPLVSNMEGIRGGSTSVPLPLSSPPTLLSARAGRHVNTDDDEEAGGESPSTTAALRSALQAIRTSQSHSQHHVTPQPSQTEKQKLTTPSPSKHSSCSSPSNGGGVCVSPSDNNHFVNCTSHALFGTQYSPTFENLLGELEAYSPGELGGGLLFAPLEPPMRRSPSSSSATTLPPTEQISGMPPARNRESVLGTPPSTSVTGHIPLQSVLQRASLHRQLLQRQQQQGRQQQQQQVDFNSHNMSDESQVIFYQMGLGDQIVTVNDSSARGLQFPSQTFAADGEPRPVTTTTTTTTNNLITATAVATTTSSTTMAVTETVATLRDNVTGPPISYGRSAANVAVFLITKDIINETNFNWDTFTAQFPSVRRTTKPEECTHYVVAKPSKTEQFLCCLAAGRWILTPMYLTACMESGHLVNEERFEWSTKMATMLGCRSSVVSLVRGCPLQRASNELPFARWQVQVCCTSTARSDSFRRVLRSGGCTSLVTVTAEEVLASANTIEQPVDVDANAAEKQVVLADDTVFTEEELEQYAQCATARHLSPILRLDYLVQCLCTPETPQSEMDLLQSVRARKRTRKETSSAH